MLRPHGYITITADRLAEFDCITCGHCGRIIKVKPGTASTVYLLETLHVDPVTRRYTMVTKEEAGAFCRSCMRPVCLPCCDKGICLPLMKQIEQMEAQGHRR